MSTNEKINNNKIQQEEDEHQQALLSGLVLSMYSQELSAQRRQSMRMVRWFVIALVAVALFACSTAIAMSVMNSNKYNNNDSAVTTVTSILSKQGVGAAKWDKETDSSTDIASLPASTSSSSEAASSTSSPAASSTSEGSETSEGTSVPRVSSTSAYVPTTVVSVSAGNGTVLYSSANKNAAAGMVAVAVIAVGGALLAI